MQRLLFIVVVLFVAWKILAVWGKRLVSKGAGAEDFSRFSARSRDRRRRVHEQRAQQAPELLACSTCGTLVPTDRAVAGAAGLLFCSPECAAKGRQAKRGGG